MREIFKFKDLDKELSLAISSNELVYLKRENGKNSTNLTKAEIELINKVLTKIVPSKKLQDLGIITYKEEKIKHLYDKVNDLHIFSEEKTNNITEGCRLLSYLYNNQCEYVAFSKQKEEQINKRPKEIKRIVRVGKKVLVVVVSMAFLLSGYQIANSVDWLMNDNEAVYVQTERGMIRQIQVSDIYEALKHNHHLTKEEKEFFMSNPKFFEDNSAFWDYDYVMDTLKKLKIVYTKEDDPTVAGYYNWTGDEKNTITFYESKKFSDVPKYLVSHEFLHTFTNFSDSSFNNLYEIVNVVFNNEYFSQGNLRYDYTYHNLTKYFYVLAEIIEPEVLRKYHANNDINYIIEALGEIIPSQNMALSLLQDIDFLGKLNLVSEEGQLDFLEEAKLRDKMITSTLQKYYEAKYQSSIVDNYNALYWLNKDLCFTKLSAELGFQGDVMLAADDYSETVQYKKIFNLTGKDNLTILLPSAVLELSGEYKPVQFFKYQVPYDQTKTKTM